MKSIQVLIFSILLVLACGCCECFNDRDAVKGSGVSMTEERELAAFTGLDLSGAYDVTITCGAAQRFTITGEDNILPLIVTEVKGDTLHVKPSEKISTKITIEIVIGCEMLNAIHAAGAVNLGIAEVDVDRFDIDLAGTASLGATGRAREVDLTVAGTADVDTNGLSAETVSVTINGAGHARVHASKSLNAVINGTGNITYSGNPENVSQNVSGLGVIIKK